MIPAPNYLMPAEWHRHAATQLHWPSNQKIWLEERQERVEEIYCQIIEELHFYEPIHLFVESLAARNQVMQKLSLRAVELDRITIHQQKINTNRARDCGPVFVKKDDQYAITDWGFNGWGNKYNHWQADEKIPEFIAEKYGIERLEPGIIMEGGSIDVNGEGALLTTESVLLNPNRNPGLSKQDIEEKLRYYLGAEQIIWLKHGLSGDDTDGQIDNVTRWLNENTVLTMVCEDKNDVNYYRLQENLEILRSVTLDSEKKKKLNIEILPLPGTKLSDDSRPMPASYANFYIANGLVLVPLFDNRYDEQAIELFKRYFPGRKIIGIPGKHLGPRSIHGITQPWYGPLSS